MNKDAYALAQELVTSNLPVAMQVNHVGLVLAVANAKNKVRKTVEEIEREARELLVKAVFDGQD